MSAAQQEQARRALAFLIGTLRPDWDPQGITATIDQLHRDRENLGDISRAAVGAALTTSTQTPGGIASRIRNGWTEGTETKKQPTPGPPGLARCNRCGRIQVPGLDHSDNHCRPGDPDVHQRGAAEARAAIQAYHPPAHLQPQARHDTVEAHAVTPQPEPERDQEEPNDEEVEMPF